MKAVLYTKINSSLCLRTKNIVTFLPNAFKTVCRVLYKHTYPLPSKPWKSSCYRMADSVDSIRNLKKY